MTRQTLKTNRIKILFFTFAASMTLMGCVFQDSSTLPQNTGAVLSSSSATSPTCYKDRYKQPFVPTTSKLDLLFVVDSSGSLQEERTRIGGAIDLFIAEFPADGDFRIGMMLAHGSLSSRSGSLYKSNIAGDNWVLDSKQLSTASIRSILRQKMASPPSDYYADGGEEALYSLNLALDSTHLSASRSKGFFRSDAALAIVFVADENDICAQYPAGATPVADPDHLEGSAFQRDCIRQVAASTVNGITVPAHTERLLPSTVVEKLRALQGDRPLIISGIIYATQNYPKVGENEYGYGYMEAIQESNGMAVDLALNDLEGGLASIGSYTANRIILQTDFTLGHTGLAPETIEVFVDNILSAHTYSSSTNKVTLQDPGKSLSEIEINYCLKPEDDSNCTGLSCGVLGT